MTVNINVTPNHLTIHSEPRVTHWFGELQSCRPVLGHDAVRAEWAGRMGMVMTRASAIELVRSLTEALASATWPDCSGAAVDLGEPA